jgi:G8 domain
MFHAPLKTSIALTIGLFATTEATMPVFVPLACNANVDKVKCDTWTDRFGVRTTFPDLVIVPCGECIFLDRTISGSTLTFETGIDIQGKLVFLEGTTINIRTPMITVQGELEMYAAKKAVNGTPSIHILMTGQNAKQSYIAIGENSKKCSDDGTARCEVGKKSITVSGGKVNSKYPTSDFILLILSAFLFSSLVFYFLLFQFKGYPQTLHRGSIYTILHT